MAIIFPNDKTGLTPPGVGPLETGDEFTASNNVLYVYDATDVSWTGAFVAPVDDGVPFPLPSGEGFIIRDSSGAEEFLVIEGSSSDDTVDDGTYIVGDF